MRGIADKYGLRGQAVGEVMGGAVISHSRDFNLAREALLDAGSDVNIADRDGASALMLAAEYGHVAVVQALLDAKASVTLRDKRGEDGPVVRARKRTT